MLHKRQAPLNGHVKSQNDVRLSASQYFGESWIVHLLLLFKP
jgi:hypothetical protein